jgi:ribosome maturation factor RimP
MVFRDENTEDIAFVEGLLDEPAGIDIIDVRRTGHGGTVEIVISNGSENIGLDDCEALTNRLNEDADFRGRFGNETILCVMSPGVERRLTTRRELEKFRGREVRAFVVGTDGRETTLTGRLAGLTDSTLILETGGEEQTVPAESIRSVRLYCRF